MKSKLFYLLKSRKFWAAIVGLAFVVVMNFWPEFPIAEDQILQVILLIVSYILGTAIEDGGRAIARS